MAEEAVSAYGLPVDVSAEQALIDEVSRTAGHVVALQGMVSALRADQLSWGKAEQTVRADNGKRVAGEGEGAPSVEDVVETKYKAAPHVLIKMYQDERKHLTDVCAKVATLRISERQVALAERQALLLLSMFNGVLDDAEVPADVRQRIEASLRRRVTTRGQRAAIEGGVA